MPREETGLWKDAGLIADIHIRVLYILNRSVTRALKFIYSVEKK